MIEVGDQVRVKNKQASTYAQNGEVVRISPTNKYLVKFATGLIREYAKGSLELWEDSKETESTKPMMGIFFSEPYPDMNAGDYDFMDDCMFVLAYSKEHCIRVLNDRMEEKETEIYDYLLFNGVVHDVEEVPTAKIVS